MPGSGSRMSNAAQCLFVFVRGCSCLFLFVRVCSCLFVFVRGCEHCLTFLYFAFHFNIDIGWMPPFFSFFLLHINPTASMAFGVAGAKGPSNGTCGEDGKFGGALDSALPLPFEIRLPLGIDCRLHP